ncbi:hypothetical protein MKW94_027128 [Papaver nudicaule]|uniref:Retrotransposon gag domain-containing protein n=1 Tax=Papaver nudicaule TaxID=74823 RepID=A0AA41VY74_PAPNU|nr:hypothetical protein [Papaver nudicaule]
MPPRRDFTNDNNGTGENVEQRREHMEATLARIVGTLGTLTDVVGNNRQPNPAMDLRAFIKGTREMVFKGTEGPVGAEKWLMDIKKEFAAMLVPAANKIRFATYLLREGANYWWESVQRNTDTTNLTWAQFERLFLDNYFPPPARAAKYEEFLHLSQGDMTVLELDMKFHELEHYGEHLVNTPELRARKLEGCLKYGIRDKIVAFSMVLMRRFESCHSRLLLLSTTCKICRNNFSFSL